MNNGNVNRALNHATILSLAKYSKVRLRKIPGFLGLLEFENFENLGKELAKIFSVSYAEVSKTRAKFAQHFQKFHQDYNILYIKDKAYPGLLRETQEPPLFLFCRGDINLFNGKGIAIVGSRKASDLGIRRARKLAALLVAKGYVVVSGLAKGIDATGHKGAIQASGKTIAVIGTPLDKSYPKENAELQEYIAQKHLLVSQFHFGHPVNRASFPTRNYTMSGISYATVIVEASETSGALIQARQCMAQGHHLFLLRNLLDRNDLKWPKKYVDKGAFVIADIEDVPRELQKAPNYQITENGNQQKQMF
jgi:DNA processing protein